MLVVVEVVVVVIFCFCCWDVGCEPLTIHVEYVKLAANMRLAGQPRAPI